MIKRSRGGVVAGVLRVCEKKSEGIAGCCAWRARGFFGARVEKREWHREEEQDSSSGLLQLIKH